MGPYLAPSLARLRSEINATHPNRDTRSDGWIGDKDHANRVSDHNPDPMPNGVVRALDIDVDGMNKDELRRVVLRDKRTEYFIQDGSIYRRATGFKKETYTGPNKHTSHGHTSIRKGAVYENDTSSWGYNQRPVPPPQGGGKSVEQIATEVLAGQWGNNPERRNRIVAAGYNYDAVQAEVNRRVRAGDNAQQRPLLSLYNIALEVRAGKWGNGQNRIDRLNKAGYNAKQVQDEVNRQLR